MQLLFSPRASELVPAYTTLEDLKMLEDMDEKYALNSFFAKPFSLLSNLGSMWYSQTTG